MSKFGERLKMLREEKNLNQTELAALFGLTQNAFSAYERGLREPNIEKMTQIADFFGVSLDFLFGRTNDRKKTYSPMTRELLDVLHLSDDEIIEQKQATIDGKPVSKEDYKLFIAQVRARRQLELMDPKKDEEK